MLVLTIQFTLPIIFLNSRFFNKNEKTLARLHAVIGTAT